MQVFARFSKRVPIRELGPTLLTVLALAGILGHGAPIFKGILDLVGQYWG